MSRQEFREKTIVALQMFEKMSTGSDGKKNAVESKALVESLVQSGKFSKDLAEKTVAALIRSGQIPDRLIISS